MGKDQDSAASDPNLPGQPADASGEAGAPVEEVFPTVPDAGGSGAVPVSPVPPEVAAASQAAGEDRGLSAGNTPTDEEALPGLPTTPVAVPPQESTQGMPALFSEASFQQPDIGSSAAPSALAGGGADEVLLDHLVTQQRLDDLWERLGAVTKQINTRIQSLEVARQLYDLVKSAREEMIAGRDHYDQAERFVNEVEYRTAHATSVMSWSFMLGILIFLYEIGFAVGLVYILFQYLGEAAWNANSSRLVYIGAAMVFGSFGGVIGASFALVKHVAVDQDFEWQHSQWYFASPVMGAGVGLVVYMILLGSLNSMMGGSPQGISSPIIIYLLAWLAGYQHNVFTDMIKRILKVFESQLGGTQPGANTPKS